MTPPNFQVFTDHPPADPTPHEAPEAPREASDGPPYIGPDRRQEMRLWRAEVNKRLDDGSEVMRSLREELAANTKSTTKIAEDTSELVNLLNSFKGAFKVLNMIGTVAKPLGTIVTLIAGVYGFFTLVKGGGK